MQAQKLYLALTRPPQIQGISYELFTLLVVVVMILYIGTQSFLILLSIIPLYFIAREINKRDPYLINVLFVKYKLTPPVRNITFWNRCNSYDPLGVE